MKKILIVSGHTDLNNSVANKNILKILKEELSDAEFDILSELYPNYIIDVKKEQEKLLNADGEPLIKHGFDWGIGKLNELYTLDVDVINMLIDDNFIRPYMSLAQLRECVKKIKNALLNR